MPTKRKTYEWTRLPRETLRLLVDMADTVYADERSAYEEARPDVAAGRFEFDQGGITSTMQWSPLGYGLLSVRDDDGATWFEDSEAEDFFDRLGEPHTAYSMSYGVRVASATPTRMGISISIEYRGHETSVSVGHSDPRVVTRIIGAIRDAAAANVLPIPQAEPERPRIFIGHGGAPDWQETERWLSSLGLEVKAYETLPHTGRTIERVLGGALAWANFALLVMSAEDELADESMQARQNVVHELGLFQGRLGWDRAIVLLEQGATEFSNISGTNQLRYPTGMISAKHGDIVVALREHFAGLIL